ncbi:rhodanese-related sulfurtransferase [Rariglobus hedericola]|uniref:tRNA uridine(34) hydroxylase n=1 Tax=Rariglobus hedericola TaxID=2597822 RepID=A0A556QNR4_9BACT|nr:rhodanese-like domain-containing protein [Rariglobus hedericola]TSJ78290.1 sulfurtransferase [Rariglobus hedericola]
MSSAFLNISSYKFTPFESDELPAIRDRLLEVSIAQGLKGTILLSTEGINLFVAGPTDNVNALLAEIRTLRGLDDLTPKESFSGDQPFNRMLVKIKKEIISFGLEGIDPARKPAPKLSPKTLKQWLDEGRKITLLDTRNDYEVRLGTFTGAIDPRINTFRAFPDAVSKLPEELKTQPIVMFCTGGIRCEKAGPLMMREGFENVFQLDGGILKYFEECGGAHYEGECFVFDRRVGVNADLKPTGSALCWVCQMPLTLAEQRDERYVYEKSCPYCFKTAGA